MERLETKQINGRTAQRVNRLRGWKGHVWQGRFFSSPLDDLYLWMAIRYRVTTRRPSKSCDETSQWVCPLRQRILFEVWKRLRVGYYSIVHRASWKEQRVASPFPLRRGLQCRSACRNRRREKQGLRPTRNLNPNLNLNFQTRGTDRSNSTARPKKPKKYLDSFRQTHPSEIQSLLIGRLFFVCLGCPQVKKKSNPSIERTATDKPVLPVMSNVMHFLSAHRTHYDIAEWGSTQSCGRKF